jgi:hypothetical protein
MRRANVKRLAGLGVVDIASNITAFELFFDNKSFSLIWHRHFGVKHRIALQKTT